MHSNIPQPVTESNPSPLPQTSSSVVMLSDDEQETDEEQELLVKEKQIRIHQYLLLQILYNFQSS